ncbi:MAG: alpha-glucosidase C-terminal domain-containing protein [Bacteroidales bacterium]|nr:alpha-glucosidase C-terminal domain-containing protein [Bacteroidales bacterium]
MKHIIYQLLPRLWGSGKFSSVDTGSLAYFKGLGVDYIWYTGIIRHASKNSGEKVVKGDAGSPYAITDYYDVNPYLADNEGRRMEEFGALIDRTHAMGLKVIMDFVPNHVARENVNFTEEDFFCFPGEELKLPVDADGYTEMPARASGNCFSATPGINDWYETVKLNYGDRRTRTWDKMLKIVRFWASKGVDGFRCDMVELVPPQFMQWLIASIKEEFPGVIFIAEVYEKEKYRMYVNEVGFDLLYDKSGLYDTLRAVTCNNATARSISWNWQFLGDLQPNMLNFLENHDEQRLASDFFCGTASNAYAALAVSALLNDAPFMLYFGQEIGEKGMDQEGFSGRDGRTTIFDWWKIASIERLNTWIKDHRKGLNSQEKAVLKTYTQVLELAKTPAFAQGKTFDLCYCQDSERFNADKHFAFLRSDGKKTMLVVSNFAWEEPDITVRIPTEALDYLEIKLVRTVYTLTVPAHDFRIIEIN